MSPYYALIENMVTLDALPASSYEVCDYLAKVLKRGEASKEFSKMDALLGEEIEETGDFIVNEKDKIVTLTADGIKRVEEYFNIVNKYSTNANAYSREVAKLYESLKK